MCKWGGGEREEELEKGEGIKQETNHPEGISKTTKPVWQYLS